jgi:uncharacterized Tic20 family protein
MDNSATNSTTKRCYEDYDSRSLAPTTTISLSELDPPPSRSELLRDKWLDFLSGKVHFCIGITVMFMIVVDGAFFFFLLIGAQNMCQQPSRTDCNPRNWWYNFSIQFLNVLFTYLATISLPWRLSNAVHLFNGSGMGWRNNRSSDAGLDLYGQPTDKIWFHISQTRRRLIIFFLILNSLTQYANQASRIIFYSFELQDVYPGTLWVNLFFALSMMCAAVGGFLQLHAEMKLRNLHPERYPPSPFETLREYTAKARSSLRRDTTQEEEVDEEVEPRDGDIEEDQRKQLEKEKRSTFVRNIRNFFKNDTPSLGLWGL